jgi:hypothetical protein
MSSDISVKRLSLEAAIIDKNRRYITIMKWDRFVLLRAFFISHDKDISAPITSLELSTASG